MYMNLSMAINGIIYDNAETPSETECPVNSFDLTLTFLHYLGSRFKSLQRF